jgi:uncharacterized protein (DUF924 family)
MTDARYRAILDFWFLPPADPGHGRDRPVWLRPDLAFETAIHEHFGSEVEAALAGERAPAPTDASAVLATILLLDPFPRTLFRGTARAFAGDARALELATALVSSGRDKNLPPLQRWFVFVPFMHSEQLINQERAVALFAGLRREGQHPTYERAYDDAVRHRDIVERFGRFPHRNAALGRPSTPEETVFLTQSGSRFES